MLAASSSSVQPPKMIGDILGHRDPDSTSAYLRVATDRLRAMALPGAGMTRVTAISLAKDIDQFLVFKRALGYSYRRGEATLRSLQRFACRDLRRQRPRSIWPPPSTPGWRASRTASL